MDSPLKKLPKYLSISKTKEKKAYEKFKGKKVTTAIMLFKNTELPTIVSEFIYDADDEELTGILDWFISESLDDKNWREDYE